MTMPRNDVTKIRADLENVFGADRLVVCVMLVGFMLSLNCWPGYHGGVFWCDSFFAVGLSRLGVGSESAISGMSFFFTA